MYRHGEANHGRAEVFRNLSEELGVIVVGHSLDDGASTLGWVTRVEDARSNKDWGRDDPSAKGPRHYQRSTLTSIASQLHHQSGIGYEKQSMTGEE